MLWRSYGYPIMHDELERFIDQQKQLLTLIPALVHLAAIALISHKPCLFIWLCRD
ncbi:hypothetical protein QTP86_019256 [Hemibagrus guttatus]|nr:hypothetical protein QTP86_019256 [Hemibagrus guttatus]